MQLHCISVAAAGSIQFKVKLVVVLARDNKAAMLSVARQVGKLGLHGYSQHDVYLGHEGCADSDSVAVFSSDAMMSINLVGRRTVGSLLSEEVAA